jgi:hypothetical protein
LLRRLPLQVAFQLPVRVLVQARVQVLARLHQQRVLQRLCFKLPLPLVQLLIYPSLVAHLQV